jgi:hypothetical protein
MSEHSKMPEEVITAMEYAVRTCAKHKVLLAGFAMKADPPAIMNFGTDADITHSPEFYAEACRLTEIKIQKGLVRDHKFTEVI